jgi:hypothetical protein
MTLEEVDAWLLQHPIKCRLIGSLIGCFVGLLSNLPLLLDMK